MPRPRASASSLLLLFSVAFSTAEAGVDRWTPFGPIPAPVRSFVLSPAEPETVYVATVGEGGFWEGCDQLFRSADGGGRWQRLAALPVCSIIYQLAPHPTDPRLLYLATSAGLLQSRDRGERWTSLSPAFTSFAAVLPGPPQVLLAGGHQILPGTRGLYRSADGGRSWSMVLDGGSLDAYAYHRTPLRLLADPADPSRLYLYVFEGVTGGADEALYRSEDGGRSWEEIPHMDGLQILPGSPSTLFATNPLQQSFDGGDSWEPAPFAGEELLVVAPGRGQAGEAALYLSDGAQVQRSVDGGATWEPVPSWDSALYPLIYCRGHAARPGWIVSGFDPLQSDGNGLVSARFVDAPAARLAGGRFEARAAWWDGRGRSGTGWPLHAEEESALLAFYRPDLPDLAFKVLDGRAVNGYSWLFTAALTGAGHELTVTDLATGEAWDRVVPPGRPGSSADLRALPSGGASAAGYSTGASGPGEGCTLGGRFTVAVSWQPLGGPLREAAAAPVGDGACRFWFRREGNVEVVAKLVDGRAVNGHYWLFVGGLSSLSYKLTATDIATAAQRVYANPAGSLASWADVEAFPP